MKFLSIDLEATGLDQDCRIIEIGLVPFCTQSRTIETSLAMHFYIKCPSFEELAPNLNPWVKENNEQLIRRAHQNGIEILEFKKKLTEYLISPAVLNYFQPTPKQKIILFGKSMNAIDLPFLNRDLGWDYMREHFHHQVFDLSSVVYSLIDLKLLPEETTSGSKLMKHLQMGDVAHTALQDAINTAKMYLKILESSTKL